MDLNTKHSWTNTFIQRHADENTVICLFNGSNLPYVSFSLMPKWLHCEYIPTKHNKFCDWHLYYLQKEDHPCAQSGSDPATAAGSHFTGTSRPARLWWGCQCTVWHSPWCVTAEATLCRLRVSGRLYQGACLGVAVGYHDEVRADAWHKIHPPGICLCAV